MNRLKLILISLTFILISSSSALADGHKGKKRGERFEKIKAELDLTDEQAEQFKSTMKEARSACKDIDSRKEKRQCMKGQKDSINESLGTFLSDDQLNNCLLYTSPSPRDATLSRMPSSA